MPRERLFFFFRPAVLISCRVRNDLHKQKNWIRENDVAGKFCMDPKLVVEEAFLQFTDEEINTYIRHAEYF